MKHMSGTDHLLDALRVGLYNIDTPLGMFVLHTFATVYIAYARHYSHKECKHPVLICSENNIQFCLYSRYPGLSFSTK